MPVALPLQQPPAPSRLDDRVLQLTTQYCVVIPILSAPYMWFPHLRRLRQ